MVKVFTFVCVFVLAGCANNKQGHFQQILHDKNEQLVGYAIPPKADVMILGTHHFNKEELSFESQASLEKLLDKLLQYPFTKIVLELEPHLEAKLNERFVSYLKGEFDLSHKENEVYQIGFKLAKRLGHKKIYLFDNQTEYIGSLQDFSFESFLSDARENDAGFYDLYEQTIMKSFEANTQLLSSQNLYTEVVLRNSPKAQRIRAERMHAYENRVGIGRNWIGSDWLARWYQRNIRMAGHIQKIAEADDKLLIVVGDNHKWVLENILEYTPELNVVSSWGFLSQE